MSRTIHTREQAKLIALLRDMRLSSGLRQVDLAKRLRRPQSFVSKYETGERRLDVIELRDVCRALDVSLGEFVEELEKTLATARTSSATQRDGLRKAR